MEKIKGLNIDYLALNDVDANGKKLAQLNKRKLVGLMTRMMSLICKIGFTTTGKSLRFMG